MTQRNRSAKNISEKTFQAVLGGARVFWSDCTMVRTGDRIDMVSRHTGKHSLLIAATDATRLDAHWKGFVHTAQQRATA